MSSDPPLAFKYNVVSSTIATTDNKIEALLEQDSNCRTVYYAPKLTLKMTFYKGGYVRVRVDDPASPRFSLDDLYIEGEKEPIDK